MQRLKKKPTTNHQHKQKTQSPIAEMPVPLEQPKEQSVLLSEVRESHHKIGQAETQLLYWELRWKLSLHFFESPGLLKHHLKAPRALQGTRLPRPCSGSHPAPSAPRGIIPGGLQHRRGAQQSHRCRLVLDGWHCLCGSISPRDSK